jgi:hypothetical protein
LIGKNLITPARRVGSARPLEEAMLCIPDAVVGAVGADRFGNREWLDIIRHTMTEVAVALR